MRKPGPSRLADLIGLTLLSLAAFLLRTPQLDMQSLWRHEVDVIRLADQTLPHLIRSMAQVQHNGPLYYLLMRGWLGLTGRSEFALRYFALCSGMLSVPLMYQVGKQLASRRAGIDLGLTIYDGHSWAFSCRVGAHEVHVRGCNA